MYKHTNKIFILALLFTAACIFGMDKSYLLQENAKQIVKASSDCNSSLVKQLIHKRQEIDGIYLRKIGSDNTLNALTATVSKCTGHSLAGEVVQALSEVVEDVNPIVNDETILHMASRSAAKSGHTTLVEALLKAGANPHENGNSNHTPYEMMARYLNKKPSWFEKRSSKMPFAFQVLSLMQSQPKTIGEARTLGYRGYNALIGQNSYITCLQKRCEECEDSSCIAHRPEEYCAVCGEWGFNQDYPQCKCSDEKCYKTYFNSAKKYPVGANWLYKLAKKYELSK